MFLMVESLLFFRLYMTQKKTPPSAGSLYESAWSSVLTEYAIPDISEVEVDGWLSTKSIRKTHHKNVSQRSVDEHCNKLLAEGKLERIQKKVRQNSRVKLFYFYRPVLAKR